jgi:hypothetical protein
MFALRLELDIYTAPLVEAVCDPSEGIAVYGCLENYALEITGGGDIP